MARIIPDRVWGALTVYAEARGESQRGRVMVAEVIWTRMRTRYLSDGTVEGTVLRSKQFSCWNDSDPNRVRCARLDEDDPLYQACFDAFEEGERRVLTDQANHYLNPEAVGRLPSWYDPKKIVAKEGRHVFLRL